jgi:2-oxoisovalerate dehydrogenase E2 component (dihydrolipoyl transacylase)
MANDATNNGGGGGAKVLTSPAVRKLGRENNIDLGTVMGTGPGGRVLKADVLGIINPAPSSSSSSSSSSPISPSPSPPRTTTIAATAKAGGNAAVPIRGYHRLMVKTMTTSLQVPHMVYSDEVNVDALTAVRDSLRPLYAARQHSIGGDHPKMGKLTYMPFFVKAASLALTSYPVLNSTIDVGEMTLTHHDEHRIGIAVDTPKGLAVPVVGDCRNRSVLEIADELNRLYSLVSDRGGGGGGGGDSGDIEGLSLYIYISLPLSLSLFASSRGRVLGFLAFFSLTFFLGPPTSQC